jgi:4-amino-4-deoxy-L-arabinose transferase-like glycosyltransferase
MRLKFRRELLLIIVFFLAIVAIVNPFRELLTQDDGWAYARTVKHMVETGEYHLDEWATGSMPSQIYLGAALARMFGYSLSLLRMSTLILYLAGAVAFYQLLRESDVNNSISYVLALTLTCSPLILWLGFTFMTIGADTAVGM